MKKIIKALAILLSCAAITSVGGLMACDGEDYESNVESDNTDSGLADENDLNYTLSSDGTYYIVSGYSGSSQHVEIPSTYNNLPVKEIKNYAFYYCDEILSIVIPDSITYIGTAAFEKCESLESITIPEGVTYLGDDAFSDCYNLKNFYYNAISCTIGTTATYVYPDGLFKNAGKDNNELIITIGENVTKINACMFYLNTYNIKNYITQVLFKNIEGWYVTQTEGATSGTDLSSSDLTNTSTAATYLKNNYAYYYWYNTNL